MIRYQLFALSLLLAGPLYAQTHPGSDEFIERAAAEHGLDADKVAAMVGQAEYKQSIVDAMTRPAEGKPWFEYRPIFITPQRIDEGVTFWTENRELIDSVSKKFEVDPQVIVAIIGVETYYGRITGSYRVLDALATLSFHYPSDKIRDRSEFFTNEFMEFFLLGQEEGLPLDEVTGSYAGAMGMGQFIPSSYRAYSVDLDGDGSRDLWRSTPDAVGSVANYLAVHGWEFGGPVMRRAMASSSADFEMLEKGYKPDLTVMELHGKGYKSSPDLDPDRKAAILKLDEENRKTYWLTFQNFYVITRYNRSPLYATAVFQLSEELKARMESES